MAVVHCGIPKPSAANARLNDLNGHIQALLGMLEGSGDTVADLGRQATRQEYNGPYDLTDGTIRHNLAGVETSGIKSGATLWDASTYAANVGSVLNFAEGNQNGSVHYLPILRNATGGTVQLDQYTYVFLVHLPGTAASTYNVLSSNTENGTANTNAANGIKLTIPNGGLSFRLRHWNAGHMVRIADRVGAVGWNLVMARGVSGGGAELLVNSLERVSGDTITQTDWNLALPNGKMHYMGAGGGSSSTNWLPDSFGGPISLAFGLYMDTFASNAWFEWLLNDWFLPFRARSREIIGARQIVHSTTPWPYRQVVNAAGDETVVSIGATSSAQGVEAGREPQIGVLVRKFTDTAYAAPVWSNALEEGDIREVMKAEVTCDPDEIYVMVPVYRDGEAGTVHRFPGPPMTLWTQPAYQADVLPEYQYWLGDSHMGSLGSSGEGGESTGAVPSLDVPYGPDALRNDPPYLNQFNRHAVYASCLHHRYANGFQRVLVGLLGDDAMFDATVIDSTDDHNPEHDERAEYVNKLDAFALALGTPLPRCTSNHDTPMKGHLLGDKCDIFADPTPLAGNAGAAMKQMAGAFIRLHLIEPAPTDLYSHLTGLGAFESTAEYEPSWDDLGETDAAGNAYPLALRASHYVDAAGLMTGPRGYYGVIPWGKLLIYYADTTGVCGWPDKQGLAAASAAYGGIGPCGGQHQRILDTDFRWTEANCAMFLAHNALEGFTHRLTYSHAFPNSDQVVQGTGRNYNRNTGQMKGVASTRARVATNGHHVFIQAHNHTLGRQETAGLVVLTAPAAGAMQTWGNSQAWVNGKDGLGSYGTSLSLGAKLFDGVTDNREDFQKRVNMGAGHIGIDADWTYEGWMDMTRLHTDASISTAVSRCLAPSTSVPSIATATPLDDSFDDVFYPLAVAIVALADDIASTPTWFSAADWVLFDDASATWAEWNYAILDRCASPLDAGGLYRWQVLATHGDTGGTDPVYLVAVPIVWDTAALEAAPFYEAAELDFGGPGSPPPCVAHGVPCGR